MKRIEHTPTELDAFFLTRHDLEEGMPLDHFRINDILPDYEQSYFHFYNSHSTEVDLLPYFREAFSSMLDPNILGIKLFREYICFTRDLQPKHRIISASGYYYYPQHGVELYTFFFPEDIEKINFEENLIYDFNRTDLTSLNDEIMSMIERFYSFIEYYPDNKESTDEYVNERRRLLKKIQSISPMLAELFHLFGDNRKAYEWHTNSFQHYMNTERWHQGDHAFYDATKALEQITRMYIDTVEAEIIEQAFRQLIQSQSQLGITNQDDEPTNMLEDVRYLREQGFSAEELAREIYNEIERIFQKLAQYKKQIVLYYLFTKYNVTLEYGTRIPDLEDLIYDDLAAYFRKLTNSVISKIENI